MSSALAITARGMTDKGLSAARALLRSWWLPNVFAFGAWLLLRLWDVPRPWDDTVPVIAFAAYVILLRRSYLATERRAAAVVAQSEDLTKWADDLKAWVAGQNQAWAAYLRANGDLPECRILPGYPPEQNVIQFPTEPRPRPAAADNSRSG